jgi:diguanylate cyclase (GGDEF)-like protein/PAS domain S-box-containing protein
MASPIFISRGKCLKYVNCAAEVLTGYTREELLSMDFWDLVVRDSKDLVIRDAASRRQIKILTKDHQERWLEITGAAIEFEGVPSRLVSAFDFTEHKRLEERAQLLAVTDPLTGLGNYGRLREVLGAEINRFGRTGRPFAVLLLDLDGLKEINDRYGHLVGSRALCRLGDVLRTYCRVIDTAARYGGDEFALVLPETTAESARVVAARIRERMATDSERPPLSVSVGAADFPNSGETVEALLSAADRELYDMKSGIERLSNEEIRKREGLCTF